jgi:exodeoxyribonuclease VII large subunit
VQRARAGFTNDGHALKRVAASAIAARARDLERQRLALAAHDPERTLARGYALVENGDGEVITSTDAARRAGRLAIRFSDGSVDATVEDGTT